MEKIKEFLKYISVLDTVSGTESIYAPKLVNFLSGYFDDVYSTRGGNVTVHIKSSRKDAKKLLIDAHADKIGFIVSSVESDGFVGVVPVGGVDARVLAASDVIIHGKRDVAAVICSTPPHLAAGSDDKLVSPDKVMLDTSLSDAGEAIPVGSSVSFAEAPIFISDNCVISPALDNSICVASVLSAAYRSVHEGCEPFYDTYILLSSREESGGFSGIRTGVSLINPDIVIVTDVNFARFEGVPKRESAEIGGGAMISLSALTDKTLTDGIIRLAGNNGISLSEVVEGDNLGTNGNVANLMLDGALLANMSVPLSNMHSSNELCYLSDAECLAKILHKVITEGVYEN